MDEQIIKRTRRALEANGFRTEYLENRSKVNEYLASVMEAGSSCAVGGSVSLFECDVFSLLRSGRYEFYDRYEDGVDIKEIYRKSFSVDYYLASANAITENGELIFIDGRGNRVAAIAYGPDNVILIVSVNKICKNIKEAWLRCKKVACPKNVKRLNIDAYCAANGECRSCQFSEDDLFLDSSRGCKNTICSDTLIISRQTSQKDRITVVLVNDDIGY